MLACGEMKPIGLDQPVNHSTPAMRDEPAEESERWPRLSRRGRRRQGTPQTHDRQGE